MWTRIATSFFAMLAAIALAPLIGSSALSIGDVLNQDPVAKSIFWEVRAPRVLLSAIAGGGLAVAGLLFQALLRDALATPYTLGISSGSSLGAVMAICFGWGAVWPFALAGGIAALFVVLGIAQKARRMSSFALLLAGVTVNSMAMALILFLQSATTMGQSLTVVRWLMGSIEVVDARALGLLAAVVIPLTVLLLWRAADWNLLAVGEDWAAARGVSVERTQLIGYLAGSVLTASITTLTGPIGFVGLIVPHALRLWLGADHRVLLPCSLFGGAAFLVACDAVARVMMAPADVPVGVVTALAGGPFFIWLLRSRQP
ncbi:MAG: iron ABC transporter permease [Acidobacteria bacterium]|nr:iron ABC transporter permease [Acidobacteriota bacterium]